MGEELPLDALLFASFLVLTCLNPPSRVLEIYGRKLDEKLLNKLNELILSIKPALDDAEQKQFSNLHVKEWLDKVKNVMFEAKNLLDEIDYEQSKCKAVAKKVWNFLESYFVRSFDKEIESRTEQIIHQTKKRRPEQILNDLEDLASQTRDLGLKESNGIIEVVDSRNSQEFPCLQPSANGNITHTPTFSPTNLVGPNPKTFTNDVLLVCAEDTLAGFMGQLCNDLRKRGFRTILVGEGEELKSKAIKESMIVIVNLSKLYPCSPSLLDKLAVIVDEFSKDRMGRLLLPVFFDVERSHVRHQCGSYGQALAVHKNCVESERFEKWSDSLTKVTDSSGCHFKRDREIYEYRCIEEILQVVSEHYASVIGLHPRVKEVTALLYRGSDDGVHVVGICGDPGMGKKTIARGVCDLIAGEEFDNYCFLDAVGENLKEHGLVHLLHMFLSEVVGNNYITFGSFEEGMSVIKHTLNQKKVLITLVGIDSADVLKAVIELNRCFGSGSRVLIIAQDKFLLESHGIKRIYDVKRLERVVALQLLCLKAFGSMKTKVGYMNIINRAETCASGNPLVLEVIGSHFRGKTIEECKFALDLYERNRNAEMIQKMVRQNNRTRLSEDSFEEHMEYVMRDAQPATDDKSRVWDPMEMEYQLCSTSSSLDAM